ncbi:MAG TPA: penicillin-binding protein 1C, partial [Woeseiaceae bacterium]|nr:penicillin-binding protein 1C [Woeseiaceae bacterium]
MRGRRIRVRAAAAAAGATVAMLATLAAGLVALCLCPKPSLYGDTPFSTAVEDRGHRLLRLALAGDERYRLPVPLADVAPHAVAATLLYEDRYYRRHPGVNPAALARAAWSTYVTRERTMGASTITMQLARLRFGLDTRSVGAKLVQVARALQLERHYTKDEILEAYLNLAPYGANIEGIGTAALVYFDKPAARLSLPEALALAVIPQNPADRYPATGHGYAAMDAARQRLLAAWSEAYGLEPAARAQFTLPLAVRAPGELPFEAAHFVTTLLAEPDGDGDGGTVTSTLDLSLQRRLESHVANHVGLRRTHGVTNASAMLLDHRSMAVLAAVGSADFHDAAIAGQVDGTSARRSPGSTLKPFLYGLAIDRGLVHPMTLLEDAPRRYASYAPENFDRGFMGPVFAQDALIYSRNVPAIELLNRLGLDAFHGLLADGGVADLQSAEHYGLAMILGGLEMSMEELVALYAALPGGGIVREPVRTADAESADGSRILSAESAFLVLDMLARNPRPDGLPLGTQRQRPAVAWKTGTSYGFRDAWTVGVVGPWVLAVWVGNFDGSANAAFVGRQAAAPLFFAIVDDLADDLAAGLDDSYGKFEPAPGLNVVKVDVCASTGDLPGRYCPGTTESWFVPGVSPIAVSDVHRAVRIDTATGLRSCSVDPRTTREAVYEFWPSDIASLFRAAGIAVRRPPPWAPECELGLRAATGAAPRISSLSPHLGYVLRPDRLAD